MLVDRDPLERGWIPPPPPLWFWAACSTARQSTLSWEEEEAEATLLHVVARKGHYDTAQHLLSQRTAAVNSQDACGRTPLFWATEYRHESLVELLLSHGADVAARDNEGNLCLHWAAYVGCVPIARMLMDAGSDLNTSNAQGDSPLHLAAQERRYECLVLFLAHGANVSLKNKAGQVPLQCSKHSSPTWRALKAVSALAHHQVERILCRDISRGFEQVPIPCLNGVDNETCPSDFLYITQNIVSDSVVLPTTGWGRSQHCVCPGACSAATCLCILRNLPSYATDGRLLPDAASSAAEMGPIYECTMLCSCPSSCPNRVVQKGLRTQLQLYRMPDKGWGVRTMQDVPRGAFICQYFGELVSSAEAARREDDTYYFVVDMQAQQECCLDGRFYGSVGRFLNHSCQPNLVALQVALSHEIPSIAFFSIRAIQAGEELGFDYGDRFWEAKGWRWPCLCQSPSCRYPSPRRGVPAAGDPGPLRGFAHKSKRASPLKRFTRSCQAREPSRP
ncbi:histone-lysine N-methyltransferase EHMT1-like [Rhineura floridana]|uniref:histone-lysine N-methyltransferase EHMT1-like n=1 Tax=Rhineura floridana TaxID=261503 RepID=UPI002AC877BA|nr:histone-lysine N-methyltransferase EHMT1-like [Rhineura floridana]